MTTDTPAAAGFTGYASTFWAADSYGTAFAPGCFAKSLAERGTDFPCLWQHNPDAPIGRHLAIREDATGLFVDVVLSEDGAEGSVAAARLRDEIPLAMSFGFRTRRSRPIDDDDPLDETTLAPLGIARKDVEVITAVDLFEDSVVTFPANRRAKILAVRRRKSDAQRQADAAFFRSELRDLAATERALDTALQAWEHVDAERARTAVIGRFDQLTAERQEAEQRFAAVIVDAINVVAALNANAAAYQQAVEDAARLQTPIPQGARPPHQPAVVNLSTIYRGMWENPQAIADRWLKNGWR